MKCLAVCEVCLQSYYLDDDDVYVPANMKIRRYVKKNTYIGSWIDWIMHVQSRCPMCREECPEIAREDLEKHISALQKENEEIAREDDIY